MLRLIEYGRLGGRGWAGLLILVSEAFSLHDTPDESLLLFCCSYPRTRGRVRNWGQATEVHTRFVKRLRIFGR